MFEKGDENRPTAPVIVRSVCFKVKSLYTVTKQTVQHIHRLQIKTNRIDYFFVIGPKYHQRASALSSNLKYTLHVVDFCSNELPQKS